MTALPWWHRRAHSIPDDTHGPLPQPSDPLDDRHPGVAELVRDLLLIHPVNERHHGNPLIFVVERVEQLDRRPPHLGLRARVARQLDGCVVDRRCSSRKFRLPKLIEARAVGDSVKPAERLVRSAYTAPGTHQLHEDLLEGIVCK